MTQEIIYSTKNMSTWNARKVVKTKVASRTPGSKKNPRTCQASSLDKWMAKTNSSHKHPLYGSWLLRKNGRKGK